MATMAELVAVAVRDGGPHMNSCWQRPSNCRYSQFGAAAHQYFEVSGKTDPSISEPQILTL